MMHLTILQRLYKLFERQCALHMQYCCKPELDRGKITVLSTLMMMHIFVCWKIWGKTLWHSQLFPLYSIIFCSHNVVDSLSTWHHFSLISKKPKQESTLFSFNEVFTKKTKPRVHYQYMIYLEAQFIIELVRKSYLKWFNQIWMDLMEGGKQTNMTE